MEIRRLVVKLPHKLALDDASIFLRLLYVMLHLAWAGVGLFLVMNLPVALMLLPLAVLYAAAFVKRTTLSHDALLFSIRRGILYTAFIAFLYFTQGLIPLKSHSVWMFLLFTQMPLALMDASYLAKGKLGPMIQVGGR